RTNHRPFLIRQIASCHACSLCPLSRSQEVNQISGRSYRSFVNVTWAMVNPNPELASTMKKICFGMALLDWIAFMT
ncbi:hypothetical protein, partial [Gluconobacter sp. DsW_056]|uniref:hypothetical protein n=1 Tax=Gluconobacter sp. DsW_056 TaxID=1511209 RepID=UPI001E61C578